MMHKWTIRLLVLVGVMLGLWLLKTRVFAPEPILVSVVKVERGRVEETVTNTRAGTIKARRRAHLSPEIGGRVVDIPHRKGSRVKKGDILLRLNDASQRAAVLMAQRELAVAEARKERVCLEAEHAEREYRRNLPLREQELISADFLDKVESAARTTAAACREGKAEIERAKATLEEAQAELAKTVLRAPFDGVVAELDIEVGEWTTPSPPGLPIPPVLDLIDPSSIYVSAPMDEVDSARIHLHQPVRISLDPYPHQHFEGRVVRIAPYVLDIEEQNRTVEIEVEFVDQAFASTLLPGTSADVEVILSAKDDVLRLPTSTIFEGKKVYMVQAGHVVERLVKIGLKNWDYVEIIEGVPEGALVVSSLDVMGLADGVPVRIQPSPSTP